MDRIPVSVAIMARNEAAALNGVIARLLVAGFRPEEITLMDDCSNDHPGEIAAQHKVRFLTSPVPLGLSRLLRRSLQDALERGFAYHITMDGDGQHAPEYVPGIVEALEAGADMVVSSRYGPDSDCSVEPLEEINSGNIQTTAAVERVTGLGLTDPLCGLRGYRREVMEFLLAQEFVTDTCADPHGFVLESLLRVWHHGGFRIVELPHPAIYNGGGKIATLYQDSFLEQRLERSLMHARHLLLVMRALGLKFQQTPSNG
ncbi:MAG: glycosyltransferase family 2 protein [Patescibacteria group bacterium]|nr:glycosyltransferase family 2 protein [Patescibacteria group bacterium]